MSYVGWVNKHSYGLLWDVIFYTCININGSLAKPLSKLVHVGLITSINIKHTSVKEWLTNGHEHCSHFIYAFM